MIESVRPPLSGIASKASFGMAFAASGVPVRNIPEYSESLRGFEAVEFPVEILELKEASKLLAGAINGFQYLHIGSIIDREVACNLPYASESLYDEFAAYTEKIVSLLDSIGIHTVTFDPGMNSVLTDSRTLASTLRILKLIAPVLQRTGIVLLLPFSLPCRGKETPAMLTDFLRTSMIPNLKVRLDIHPHEIPRERMLPDRLAGTLLLEVRSVLFRYDADSGNTLVPEHVKPWIERLHLLGFHGPFMAAPALSGAGRFLHEADEWSALIHTLRTETEGGRK